MFAHTSPIYLEVGDRPTFHKATAKELIEEMKQSILTIKSLGNFSNDANRDQLLEVYERGIEHLEAKIAEAAKR